MKICIFTLIGIVLAMFLIFASRQLCIASPTDTFDCDKTVDSKTDLEESEDNEDLGFPMSLPDPDLSVMFVTLADSIHEYSIKILNAEDAQADKKSKIIAALSDSLHKYSLKKPDNKEQTVENDCENPSDGANLE